MSMQESRTISRQCASALLDAWCRSDAVQMGELAAHADCMKSFYVTDPAEWERLELLGGIAVELHRACSLEKTDNLDPYIRLLLGLADPEPLEIRFTHSN
jgi:hypothetical protein